VKAGLGYRAAWSPNGDVIYGLIILFRDTSLDETQDFDLIAIPTSGSSPVRLVRDVGMFAYPVPSPVQQKENFLNQLTSTNLSQATFRVAYLKAIFSDQSETSRYKLCIIDRDGSNQIYLQMKLTDLNPRHACSPTMGSDYAIISYYNGNIC
jgi:hypothetical protein